jgi:hypothetical protein
MKKVAEQNTGVNKKEKGVAGKKCGPAPAPERKINAAPAANTDSLASIFSS